MKISFSQQFKSSEEQLVQLLFSDDLMTLRSQKLNFNNYSFSSYRDNSRADFWQLQLSAAVDLANAPAAAKSILGTSLSATLTARQNSVSPSIINYAFELGKLPVKFQLETIVAEISDGVVTLSHEGEFNVNIPFLGKKIEAQIGQKLPKIFAEDAKLISELLA